MKKNENCKIVQDLLPSYIDKLTSEETNAYIENHLKECEECTKILEEMGETVILDKIDKEKQIDFLKKVNHRHRVKISIIVTILLIPIILMLTLIFIYENYIGGVRIGEDGKPEYYEAFKQWITGENEIKHSKITHILIKTHLTIDENVNYFYLMTFDENDICIGARMYIKGLSKEEALERYNERKNQPIVSYSHLQLVDDGIIYDNSYWTGKSKKDVLETYNKEKGENWLLTVFEF